MQKSKQFLFPAVWLTVLFLLAGCGGRPRPGAAEQTVQTEQTEQTEQIDQTEQAGSRVTADSCKNPVRYNQACLAMFELRGSVETCQVECWQTGTAEKECEEAEMMWSRDYGFNSSGYLLFDGCCEYTYRADTVFLYGEDAQVGMSASLTYDAAGRIVAQRLEYEGDAVGDGEQSTEFSYDDDGRLTRTHALLWETEAETLYTYDTGGRLVAREETFHNYDGHTERIYSYEYVKYDAHGNWTERRVTVKNSAVQPVEGAEHEQSEMIRYPDAYQVEYRKITYFE